MLRVEFQRLAASFARELREIRAVEQQTARMLIISNTLCFDQAAAIQKSTRFVLHT